MKPLKRIQDFFLFSVVSGMMNVKMMKSKNICEMMLPGCCQVNSSEQRFFSPKN